MALLIQDDSGSWRDWAGKIVIHVQPCLKIPTFFEVCVHADESGVFTAALSTKDGAIEGAAALASAINAISLPAAEPAPAATSKSVEAAGKKLDDAIGAIYRPLSLTMIGSILDPLFENLREAIQNDRNAFVSASLALYEKSDRVADVAARAAADHCGPTVSQALAIVKQLAGSNVGLTGFADLIRTLDQINR